MDCSCALLGVVATLRRKCVQSVFCAVIVGMLGTSLAAQESSPLGPFRTQVIELKAGWNSVYLEIEPLSTDPDELFEGTPIEIAAAYLRPVTSQQFVESPSDALNDRKGWNVWYQEDRPDALLSDLYAINAHGAYLLYSETDYTWQLQGVPYFGSATWHPNAYSLIGYPIDAAEAPTIENFFAGVGAHAELKVYQMVDGRWNLITEPASTLMESGVAYWTYSKGASEFAGPLQVDFKTESLGGLIFTANIGMQQLVLTNVSPFPQQLTLNLEAGASGLIPLAYQVTEVNGDEPLNTSNRPLNDGMTIGPVESGASVILNLEVVRSEVSQSLMTTTVVVASDAGVRIEVPIVSARTDLESSAE